MDELNGIIQNCLDETEYTVSDWLDDVHRFSDIILSHGEPALSDKSKNRFGINNSVDLAYQFFNSFDKAYGDHFQKLVNDDFISFSYIGKRGNGISQSYYDCEQGKNVIDILYRNQIEDAFSLVHETFHDLNLDFENLSVTRNYLTEYVSIFGEFLFEKFIEDNYDIKCRINNNITFLATYTKALLASFQAKLFEHYMEHGYINDYSFNSIVNSYSKRYHPLLLRNCDKYIADDSFNIDYQLRYLLGILLSCYSYDRYLNNDFNLDVFKYINENLNNLDIFEVYQYLDLDIEDYDTLLLTPDSYNKLDKSYKKILGRR